MVSIRILFLVNDLIVKIITQCVNLADGSFDYIRVGSPQGHKLGPLPGPLYVNDMNTDVFSSIKYADDATFFQRYVRITTDRVGPAISHTVQWSSHIHMILNTRQ